MKKIIIISAILFTLVTISSDLSAQPIVYYVYSRPAWTVGFGTQWNLATNDAYGRANYSNQDQILKENYAMRWGLGGYLYGKYGMGKKKNDRVFLGIDYKYMQNSDFESKANKSKYNIVTIEAGYEYLFYGTYRFRSYYGIGPTINIIKGGFYPLTETQTFKVRTFESSVRIGMELKAGLEFIFNNRKRNFGVNVGATYNLMNLFSDNNKMPLLGQSEGESLNDGKGDGGPGFKRYIGIVSVNVGLNIYPDVTRTKKVIR